MTRRTIFQKVLSWSSLIFLSSLCVVPRAEPAVYGQEKMAVPSSFPGNPQQVGAYFFYWYFFPNFPDIDEYQDIAFHPPGLMQPGQPTCVHDPQTVYCLPYGRGSYNKTYYSSNAASWNQSFIADPVLWWKWQFREMAEAGIEIAFLASWAQEPKPGKPYFTYLERRIDQVAPFAIEALNALGIPVKVSLFDDTESEWRQWLVDNGYSETEKMPLDDPSSWEYFWQKWRIFYDSFPDKSMWATHNGASVNEGGRPIILVWFPNEHWYTWPGYPGPMNGIGRDLMVYLREQFRATYRDDNGNPIDPFILPNYVWYVWDTAAFNETPTAVDGWSDYGFAAGNGTEIRSWNSGSGYYYTASIGPGRDDYGYSGPYGPVDPEFTGAFNARWWDLEGGWGNPPSDPNRYDEYFYDSWQIIINHSPDVNLVIIESWNELVEGSGITKVESYISPEMGAGCLPDPWPQPPHSPTCNYKAFQDLHGGIYDPWGTPWYWAHDTRVLSQEWKNSTPPAPIIIDNNNSCPGQDGTFTASGNWQTAHYNQAFCEGIQDVAYTSLGPPSAEGQWQPFSNQGPALYEVYAWWPMDSGASQDVRYGVRSGSRLTYAAEIDQAWPYDMGYWNFLGIFPLDPQGGDRVILSNQATSGDVILADAVKLVYRGPYTPPPPSHHIYLPLVVRNFTLTQGGGEPPIPPGNEQGYPPPTQTPPSTPTPLPTPTQGGYPPPPTMTPPPSPSPTVTPPPTPPDTEPPESWVEPLPAYHNLPAGFPVRWSGDDAGGSGIHLFDIQYRDGTGEWTDWLTQTSRWSWWFTPVEDGHTYAFRSRATDRAGNVEPWPDTPDASTTVDLTPPSSAVSNLPPYSRASFTVSWSGVDDTSGIASYDVQVCWENCTLKPAGWTDWLTGTTDTSATFHGEDGRTYYFRSRATDRAGNVEPWPQTADDHTTVDVTPPDSAVNGLPPYSRSPFPVSWSGQDDLSGIAFYDLQVCRADCTLPSEAVWLDWLTHITATQSLYEGEEGPVYFRSRATDHAGNQEGYPRSPDASTTIDTTPPASAVEDLPAYRGASFTVSWAGQDGASGVASYDIQVCAGECNGPTGGGQGTWQDWLTQTTALSATFSGGQHGKPYAFRSRARDYAGNLEAWPARADASTTIDAFPPSSAVAGLPTYLPAVFTVTWSGQDDLSGIASFDVQVCTQDCANPSTPWTTWLEGVTTTAALFEGEAGQTYAFRSRAHDGADNAELWPLTPDATTTVDGVPPASAVVALPAYSLGTFTVTWAGQDDLSGIASFDIQVCTGDCQGPQALWSDWLTATTTLSATFSGQNGVPYAFRSRARDQVGNREAWPAEPDAVTTVDTTPPSSQVEPLPAVSPAVFTVTWSGQDDLSGIAGYDVQVCPSDEPTPDCWQDWLTATLSTSAPFSGSHGQVYAFRSRAWDALGNSEPYSTSADAQTTVDAEGPQTHFLPPQPDMMGLFTLRWEGEDAPAGIRGYDLYLRDEAEGNWVLWMEGVTTTEAFITVTAGHTYHLCLRGVDRVGNVEEKDCPGMLEGWPIDAELVLESPPTSWVKPLPPIAPGERFLVSWGGSSDVVAYDVQVLDLSEGLWQDWQRATMATEAWFSGIYSHTYAFRCRATDLAGNPLESWPWEYDTRTTVPLPGVNAPRKPAGPAVAQPQ